MRSDKLSFYRCYGLFHAESITLKSKHGIKVLNEGHSQEHTAAGFYGPSAGWKTVAGGDENSPIPGA